MAKRLKVMLTKCLTKSDLRYGKLYVWWVFSEELPIFYYPVDSYGQGLTVLDVLVYYDNFQHGSGIVSDHHNAIGIGMWDNESLLNIDKEDYDYCKQNKISIAEYLELTEEEWDGSSYN